MALVIIAAGSGQHAAVVYEAAVLSGLAVAGFAAYGDCVVTELLDCRYLGSIDRLLPFGTLDDRRCVIACGNNRLRLRIAVLLADHGVAFQSVVHPRAMISPSATVAPGSVLLAGSIIGPRVALGCGTIINHAASVDHDCVVGDYANLCPGARLGGGVRLGAGAFVGINGSVIPGLSVGDDAVIGAGAVVTVDVAASETVVGVPARRAKR